MDSLLSRANSFFVFKKNNQHVIIPFTRQRYPVLQVHAGSFIIFVIHRTLTWTTGSLMCVRDHSYACVYTRGSVGHTDSESAQQFDSENSHNVLYYCAPDAGGIRTSGLWISSPTSQSTNWAIPIPQKDIYNFFVFFGLTWAGRSEGCVWRGTSPTHCPHVRIAGFSTTSALLISSQTWYNTTESVVYTPSYLVRRCFHFLILCTYATNRSKRCFHLLRLCTYAITQSVAYTFIRLGTGLLKALIMSPHTWHSTTQKALFMPSHTWHTTTQSFVYAFSSNLVSHYWKRRLYFFNLSTPHRSRRCLPPGRLSTCTATHSVVYTELRLVPLPRPKTLCRPNQTWYAGPN